MKGNGTNGHGKPAAQPEIITRSISTAVKLLTVAGAQFKIITPDGTEYGELEVKEIRRRKFTHTYPPGTLQALYSPYINDLQPGQVAQIPYGDFPKEDLRSAVTAYCSYKWGNGSYRSCITDQHVEILRVQ